MGQNYNLKKLVFFFVSLEQRLCNIRNTKKLTVQCTIVFLFCILMTGTFLPLIEAQDLQPEKKPLKKFLKMDSTLASLYEKYQKGEDIAQFAAKHRIHQEDDMIRVVLKLDDASYENLNELKSYGIKVERQYQNRLQVMIPYSELENIGNMAFINSIKRPMEPVPDIISEGAAVMNSDVVNNAGNTGLGIKVGVIDQGFDVTNSEIAGNIQEAISFRVDNDITGGGNTDHGTAVSEIIVDVAPGVELHLYNIQFEGDLLSLITFLINNRDLDVIVMSLGFFNVGPYDGTSDLSLAVNNARSNGMLWVNSGGNSAQRHWQGQFSDTDADGFHNFAGDDETIQITAAAGQRIIIGLTWNETWGSATQDYDLVVFDSDINLVASSFNFQTGTQDPQEFISFVATSTGTFHIVIDKFSATQSVALELFSIKHNFDEYNVPSSSILIPADASGALTAGAMHFSNDQREFFSSLGPTNDGRTKPDIMGPDCVSTSAFGSSSGCPFGGPFISGFPGTSAAAPHVGGAAALTKKANPGASPATIQTLLEQNTFSNHAKNNNDGTGRVDVSFIDITAPATPTITSPTSGITTNDNTVTLTGDAESLSTVEIFDGATSLGTTTATSPWTFTTPALSDGTHTFTATATDASGNTSPPSAPVTITVTSAVPVATTDEDVIWTRGSNVGIVGNALTKNAGGDNWNAGAVSTKVLDTDANGYVETTVAETNTNRMFGLSKGDTDQGDTDTDFAIHFRSNTFVLVKEGGVIKAVLGTGSYQNADVFRVEVSGADVLYKKNGVTFYTSSGVISSASYPLLVDTSLKNGGATLENVRIGLVTIDLGGGGGVM